MRKIMLALVSATFIIILAACAKSEQAATDAPAAEASAKAEGGYAAQAASDAAPAPESSMAMRSEANAIEDLKEANKDKVTADQLTSAAASYVDGNRKFVRTANADFRVKDVYQSAMAIEDIVSKLQGFVVTNQINSNVERVSRYPIGDTKLMELAEYTVRGNLSVRVPSDKTQDLLRALVTQIDFLDQRNFEARDVQFELLRKQLEFLRNQEAQKQLGDLSTSPGKIADRAMVISGQNDAKANRDEAAVVQKEVEDKVAFSTINFSLYQLSKIRKTEIDDVDAIAKSIRPSFFNRLFNSVSSGWYGLLDIVVELFAVWPLWLAIALVFIAIKRFRKK